MKETLGEKIAELDKVVSLLDNSVADMGAKLDLLYTKIIVGNGEPPLPTQLSNINGKMKRMNEDFTSHLKMHTAHQNKVWNNFLPLSVAVLNLIVICILAYFNISSCIKNMNKDKQVTENKIVNYEHAKQMVLRK